MVLHYLVIIAQPPVVPTLQMSSILFSQGHMYPLQPPSQANHSGLSLPCKRLGSLIPSGDLAEADKTSPEAEQPTLYTYIYFQ